MPDYRVPLLALLVAWLAFGVLGAGEPARGEKPAEKAPATAGGLPNIDWWAVHQSFEEDRGAIVLSGSAWVRYRSIKLEADHIVFFRETREVYAEGNIRLREGDSELAAQVAYVDMINDRGYLIDATVRVGMDAAKAPQKDWSGRQKTDESFVAASQDKAPFLTRKDPYGVYLDVVDDPQARLNFVFHAERVVRESRYHHYAQDVFLTTDEMADPMYGLKIGRLDLTAEDLPDAENPGQTKLTPKLVRAQSARVKLGPMVLPPLPTVSHDLTRSMPYVTFDYGNSSRWGYYLLSRIGWSLGGHKDRIFDPARLYVDADYRHMRGPAAGFEFRYKTGTRPEDAEARNVLERGRGYLRMYGLWEGLTEREEDLERANRNLARRQTDKIDGQPRRRFDANLLFLDRRARDGALPAKDNLYTYRDDFRYTIDFGHHQPLRHVAGVTDVELDFRFQHEGDRDFNQEYFYNNYLSMNQPEASASARKAGDNYRAEILYRANPQDYDVSAPRSAYDRGTFTWYEPALTYSLAPFALPRGVYVDGEFQAGRLRREFDESVIDQEDFEANRVYLKGELHRPFRLMGLNFRPHAGGQVAAYDESRDGGSTVQGAFTWGLDISKRYYAVFPNAENAELGVKGLRHIIEPRIEYIGVGTTYEDPTNLYDFDAIDDLQSMQRIRLAVEQIFQSGRHREDGTFVHRDVAGFNLWMDLYPVDGDRERLLEGAWSDLLYLEGFINVTNYLTLKSRVGYLLADSRVETVNFDATLDPGGRWRITVGDRYNYSDGDRGIEGSDQIYVSFEWQLSERWGVLYQQSYQRKGSSLDREGILTQTFALTRRYGPLVGQLKYHANKNLRDHSFGVSLAPAFAYRNLVVPTRDLLVDAVEVEGDVPPEERNFDPFDLVAKKKAKAKPKGPPSAPPPPSAPAEPETRIPMRPASADQATASPATPAPARPKVGTDDWATY